MKRIITLLRGKAGRYLLSAFLFLVIGVFLSTQKLLAPANITAPSPESTVTEKVEAPETTEVEIKSSALLSVPYTVQAPFRKWNIHDESCEEAAALMYHYFLSKDKTLNVIPAQTADREILAMKAWQRKNYGVEPDLSIKKLGVFMRDYYNYRYKTYANINSADIKREVSSGHPVLVPVMTHSLENSHYGPRDSYHILLIKGYNQKGVTTNDAGVAEGRNYFYTWKTLFAAIDAQTPKMKQGREMLTVH